MYLFREPVSHDDKPAMIKGRYAMLSHIPIYLSVDGAFLTDPLWEKDLSLHLEYIEDFHIYCPVLSEHLAGERPLAKIPGLQRHMVHDIPHSVGWAQVFWNILPMFFAMRRAAKSNDILHTGGAGWPFPLSFYLVFLRRFFRFKWIMVIESSFWRLEPGERGSLKDRLRHRAYMRLLPMSLRAADARIFTQDEYRETLLGHNKNTLINPAVWYDDDQIETSAGLAARQAAHSGPRVIFPARLVAEKGVETVIEAVRQLDARHAGKTDILSLDIMGEGELADVCRRFAADHEGPVRVRFLDPVPYGAPFFEVLRNYGALIVANHKAEQARIIFDAFSQGVPVIASRTPGTLDVTTEGVNAALFDVADAKGLADALETFCQKPADFAAMGRASLDVARKFTHRGMHVVRHAFLMGVLQPKKDIHMREEF